MYILRVGHDNPKNELRYINTRATCHYVVKGAGTFNGTPITAGMGFIFRLNEVVEYGPDASDPWEYFWITMEGDDCLRYHELIGADERGVFYHALEDKLRAFYGLATALDAPGFEPLWQDALVKIALSFHQTDRARELSVGENYVRLAKQIIESRMSEGVKIRDVAEELHINRCYLRDVFQKHEGVSPQQYMIKKKMEVACQLLRETAHPIRVIADSVGYGDPLHFSREFRKETNLSPSEYRQSTEGANKTKTV